MPGTDIGIDLGTANVRIYLHGKGVVLHEPAVAAVDLDSEEVIATGSEAYQMLGRTCERVQVVHPLVNGVISDYDLAQSILSVYMKKVGGSAVFMPRVVVSVPCVITEVQKRAVVDAISSTGVRRICLIEEPVAAAIGAGVDIAKPHGVFVVDVGCGTTDMAVMSLAGIAVSQSVQTAGDAFDDSIIRYVRRKYGLIIGKRMAEQAKIEAGCVSPQQEVYTCRVKGRNALTGLPQWVDVTGAEQMETLLEPAMDIVRAVQNTLEMTPPELMGDIYEDGLYLTGGSARLRGFDTLLHKETRVPVMVPEEPENCVVVGAGKATRFIDDMENKQYGILNPLSAAY